MSSTDRAGQVAVDRPSPDDLTAAVDSLYAVVDRRLSGGQIEDIDEATIQRLMTLAVKLYVARRQAGATFAPFVGDAATATDVTVTAMAMLEAVNLDVFELSLWKGWGRA